MRARKDYDYSRHLNVRVGADGHIEKREHRDIRSVIDDRSAGEAIQGIREAAQGLRETRIEMYAENRYGEMYAENRYGDETVVVHLSGWRRATSAECEEIHRTLDAKRHQERDQELAQLARLKKKYEQ